MRRLALGLAGLAVAAALAGCGPEPVQIPTSDPTMGSYGAGGSILPGTPPLSASPASTPRKAAPTPTEVVLGESCEGAEIGDTGQATNGEWYICTWSGGGDTPRWVLP